MSNDKSKNYKQLLYLYLLLNGMSTGHLIGDLRWIIAHHFEPKIAIDTVLTLLAFHVTAAGAVRCYKKMNGNQK